MKNKYVTYALIVLVIAVWGGIVYRIVASPSPGQETQVQRVLPVKEVFHYPDVYYPSAGYTDPFLKSGIESRKRSAVIANDQVRKVKARVVEKTEPVPDFSGITFLGLIQNDAEQKKIGIIHMNGVQKLIREGDKLMDFQFSQIRRDSVQVSSGRYSVFIKR